MSTQEWLGAQVICFWQTATRGRCSSTHTGLREALAYLLVAAALTNIYGK